MTTDCTVLPNDQLPSEFIKVHFGLVGKFIVSDFYRSALAFQALIEYYMIGF